MWSSDSSICVQQFNMCIQKKIESKILNEHPLVHWSIIHNTQQMETAWMSSERWMDKENLIYK